VPGRDRAEADQVREEAKRGGAGLQLASVPDLAMPVAVGSVGELQRQIRLAGRRTEEAPAAYESIAGQLRADEATGPARQWS
jgi:hypothetical protein